MPVPDISKADAPHEAGNDTYFWCVDAALAFKLFNFARMIVCLAEATTGTASDVHGSNHASSTTLKVCHPRNVTVGLTLAFPVVPALQLQHAGNQYCGGDGAHDEAAGEGQGYGHCEQPAAPHRLG